MPLKMLKSPLEKVRNVIGILGGKGGVGKSTVTVNLALALAKQGRRVGIIDADIYGPSVHHLLGCASAPSVKEDEIVPASAQGIALISVAFFGLGDGASIVRAPIANQIIGQFLGKVKWGELDDLLIDFPPGTGDIQLTLMQQAKLTGAVAITTPQEVALLDVRKSLQMCEQMGTPILGIVENMSFLLHQGQRMEIFGEGGGRILADTCGSSLLGQIPLDPVISSCGDEGRSIFEVGASVASHFEEIAARLMSKLEGMKPMELQVLVSEDRKHFEIEWAPGKTQHFSASHLQNHCPCMRCKEKQIPLDESVEINGLFPKGDFGLEIKFSKGCSSGVYPYTFLREIGAEK